MGADTRVRVLEPCPVLCPVPETLDRVVVDHPHSLHEGIADRAADEFEPTSLQIFAHDVRLQRFARHVSH